MTDILQLDGWEPNMILRISEKPMSPLLAHLFLLDKYLNTLT